MNFNSKLTSPEIECKRLTVIDRNGKPRVILASDYPFISDIPRSMPPSKWDGFEGVLIYSDENSGRVTINGNSKSETKRNTVSLFASEHGGSIGVYDESEGNVEIIIDKHGGYVEASSGKGGRCAMCINEYGNGAVSTWDKNGYKQ
ncbi:MAG: hypothetical protein OXP71_01240 [Candidatus Poribacteria bacterium]|nr:hypothetical protein [Candidatus Poribacteria bacterium]